MSDGGSPIPPPEVVRRRKPALVRFFGGVMTRQMRKAFHAVRIARDGRPRLPPGRSVIVYLNHPSWWDPAFIMVLATHLFPDRPGFGPIDAEALERYRFMARIGLFGIERDSRRGAATFLRESRGVLARRDAMLWVTAEGHFTDARTRPVSLRPGIAHLAARVPNALLVPLAVEYPFWDERTPEALCRFGPPIDPRAASGRSVESWRAVLEDALASQMDLLADAARSRDPARFDTLIGGTVGVGGVYDLWRRGRAWLGGRRFHAGHGAPEDSQ
ncbi:Acyltransferase domain protein [Caenispirillum salinarum AK4]|uniref:Acyltransferase domain protein n=1 Tax=Caenispirillum salinarum AK4 TaxID=1238182 RepID=K9HHU4_9PROT|nr:lysophospholipid acyltransferase family protein [Caenispirillum salinarum]EKV28166.1 Acyltransferase domain protein [Caenispirillum salinarum AK4]